MSEPSAPQPSEPQASPAPAPDQPPRVVVVGPDGMAVEEPSAPGAVQPEQGVQEAQGEHGEQGQRRSITDLVEQPAKVIRVASMVKQLLEDGKGATLDEASRLRLREIHCSAIAELKAGLAPELDDELDRLSRPFTADELPSEAELRIAQAQLVGWLEGLFQGIQTTLVAQQMAARAQLEQMRRGLTASGAPAGPAGLGGPEEPDVDQAGSGGMYL